MNEKQLQKKVLQYLNELAYCTKIVLASRSGVPDIIGCYKGMFFAIELKGDSGRLTALQAANLEKIKKNGGKAIVASSVQDVANLIEEMENEQNRHKSLKNQKLN